MQTGKTEGDLGILILGLGGKQIIIFSLCYMTIKSMMENIKIFLLMKREILPQFK